MTDIMVDKSKSSPFPKHTVLVIILCIYNRLVLCMICRASLFYFSFISSTKITLVPSNYSHCSSGRTKITNWTVWLYEWKTVGVIQRLHHKTILSFSYLLKPTDPNRSGLNRTKLHRWQRQQLQYVWYFTFLCSQHPHKHTLKWSLLLHLNPAR